MSRVMTSPTAPARAASTVRPLLVKLGGAAIDEAGGLPDLFTALADLHRAHGDGVVLVHGGGAAVDRHLERLGLESVRHEGIRHTPDDQIDEVVAVLAGRVNKRLVGRLQTHGAPAVGLCLGDGNIARTRKIDGGALDPGRVGRIDGGDPALLHLLLAGGFLPVVCSIGLDDDGRPLNVNADDAAAGLAGLLGASDLVLLTDTPGVLDDGGRLIESLPVPDIEARIASGTIRGGMIAKVRSAARAVEQSAVPVTIASWNDPDGLRRLARAGGGARIGTGPRTGTRIVPRA